MGSNERQEEEVYIRVNDIFDELSEENKRLKNELMFANNCLKIFNKFKLLLSKICVKFETIIDSENKQELNQLEEEFNSVVDCKEQINETNAEISDKNDKEINGSVDENSDETNVRRSGRTERKLYAIRGKRKTNPKSDTKPKPKPNPKVIVIPEPEEEPNSLLLMKRNNFDAKTQSYVCPNPYCDKSFHTNRRLYHHFHVVHHTKKRYSCDYQNCTKIFKTLKMLSSHSIVHSEDRPFVCPVKGCDYKCKQKCVLSNHLVIHSDLRSFKCSECEKTFKIKGSLKEHMKLHSTEHAFKCRYEGCHQSFRNSYHLDRHKVIEHKHKQYRCEWPGCDFECTHARKLKNHTALHTGERRIVCEWPGCGKRFRTSNLKFKHMLIHKNERRYSCEWPGCEYRANVQTMVRQHKIWNHKS